MRIIFFDRNEGVEECEFCSSVKLTYNENEVKTDIFVGVTNLLTRNNIGEGGSFVYETNVTDIPNIDITFTFGWLDLIEESAWCKFLKGGNKPMLLVYDLPSLEYLEYVSNDTFKLILINLCNEN